MQQKKNGEKFDYIKEMKKTINSIRVGQYIKQMVCGFGYEMLPSTHCYKILAVDDGCDFEESFAYRYKTLTLEYLGRNIKLPERVKIYCMNELMPFCQIRINKTQEENND